MKASEAKPEVFNFKKKPVSLREFREEEMKRAQISRTTKDTTFQQFFDNRLKTQSRLVARMSGESQSSCARLVRIRTVVAL